MTVYDDVYIGSIPLFSIRDSFQMQREGGATHRRTNNGRNPAQIQGVAVSAISGELYPKTDADATTIRALLSVPGVIPLVLHDGTRFAIESSSESGYRIKGWYEQISDSYSVDFRVVKNAAMADLAWRGVLGAHSYHESNTNPFVFAGTPALIAGSGWNLTGSNSWGGSYIAERTNVGVRVQPRLWTRVTVAGNAHAAIGLHNAVAAVSARYLLNAGVGVYFHPSFIYIVDATDTIIAQIARSGQATYRVLVVARPRMARVEVWNDAMTEMLLMSNAVPCTFADRMGAVCVAHTGVTTLHHWWIVRA